MCGVASTYLTLYGADPLRGGCRTDRHTRQPHSRPVLQQPEMQGWERAGRRLCGQQRVRLLPGKATLLCSQLPGAHTHIHAPSRRQRSSVSHSKGASPL
eukprot:351879-Chlamydomonas_euryale.AAC.24